MPTLKERVEQYERLELPGQPKMTHLGTAFLIGDLWDAHQRLVAFVNEVLESGMLDGCGFDGADLQELGVKHQLLEPQTMTVPCGDGCACAEFVDTGEKTTCYRFSKELVEYRGQLDAG